MKTFDVHIEGVTPLLIHRFTEKAQQPDNTRAILIQPRDPRREAEELAYIDEEGHYYFSGFAIPAAMGSAGAAHKTTGSRRTLRFVVPSAVSMTSDTVTILQGEEPAASFEVDSRPVTIPSTKGKIMRHRPRWNKWNAAFNLQVDDQLLGPEMAHQLLTEAGLSYGIGDFRPQCRGPFGRFRVTRFEEVRDAGELWANDAA